MCLRVVIINSATANSLLTHHFVMELTEMSSDTITSLTEGFMRYGDIYLSTWDLVTCSGTGTLDLQYVNRYHYLYIRSINIYE